MYIIVTSDPSVKNYDYNNNPNWIEFDSDIDPVALLQRFVGDVNADEVNSDYYWKLLKTEE